VPCAGVHSTKPVGCASHTVLPKAAKLVGVSQSRVSDLVRGKWEKFSLEMLITLATRAGLPVTVKTTAIVVAAL